MYQATKSIHVVFYEPSTWSKVCAQQAVGLLSLYDVNTHIKSLHPETCNRNVTDLQRPSWQLCPSQSLGLSDFISVPQREPTNNKVFPEGVCQSESCGPYQRMTAWAAWGHKMCDACICTLNVTFKSTNASPYNMFCRDLVQEIVL